jgi:hypothetical protein
MKFQVDWHPRAEAELTRIWLNEPLSQLISLAANRIDQQLTEHPAEVGESRPNGRRILLDAPLGIYYRFYEEDRRVLVLKVWYFRKRSSEAE